MPDGRIHDGLAALKKDNRGYDLDQLLIGAEGTLGIVTAATLRIVPAVRERAVAWAGVHSPHAALALLRRAERRTDAVESFEIVAGYSLAEVIRRIPDTRPPLTGEHPWHVLVEAVRSADGGEQPRAILEELLGEALAEGVVDDAVLAASEAQAEAFWRIRHSLSEAERASGPAAQHDISVPVAGMPDFMVHDAAQIEARFPGTRATAFGHLGDGNVHFHVRAPAGVDPVAWYSDEAPAITSYVNDRVVAAGGSISAEHGIGQMKVGELAPARSRDAACGAARDQARARSRTVVQSRQAGAACGGAGLLTSVESRRAAAWQARVSQACRRRSATRAAPSRSTGSSRRRSSSPVAGPVPRQPAAELAGDAGPQGDGHHHPWC